MPFAAKSDATQKNGKVKKGYRVITDKNGRDRYMTDNASKVVKSEPKKKDVKPVVKKVKKEKVETEKVKTKGVALEKKNVVKGKQQKKKEDEKEDEEKLKVDFD